jgi:hypothetical protein
VEAAAVIAVMGHEFRIGFSFQAFLSLFLFEEDEMIELGRVVAVTTEARWRLGGNGQALDGPPV